MAESQLKASRFLDLQVRETVHVLRLESADGTNRLTRDCMLALTATFGELTRLGRPIVIAGNEKFFSAGAILRRLLRSPVLRLMNFPKWGSF